MEAQKRPLAANVVNIRCGGVVGQMDGLLKNSLPKNDPKLLKRGRDSPPNLLQKKKKNFIGVGGAAIKNDENAYDPTRTIETKIKNIKISQKNDLPLKPLMNQNNKKQQNEAAAAVAKNLPIKAVKNRNAIGQKSSSAAAFNYAETSQKAIESAKYFGSNLLIKNICFFFNINE